jgi:hypothetical protein
MAGWVKGGGIIEGGRATRGERFGGEADERVFGFSELSRSLWPETRKRASPDGMRRVHSLYPQSEHSIVYVHVLFR